MGLFTDDGSSDAQKLFKEIFDGFEKRRYQIFIMSFKKGIKECKSVEGSFENLRDIACRMCQRIDSNPVNQPDDFGYALGLLIALIKYHNYSIVKSSKIQDFFVAALGKLKELDDFDYNLIIKRLKRYIKVDSRYDVSDMKSLKELLNKVK